MFVLNGADSAGVLTRKQQRCFYLQEATGRCGCDSPAPFGGVVACLRAHAELFVFVGTLARAGNVSQVCCLHGFVTYESDSALTYFQWLPPSDKCAQGIGSRGRRKPIAGPASGSDFSSFLFIYFYSCEPCVGSHVCFYQTISEPLIAVEGHFSFF